MEFHDKLQQLRKQAGLTQEELAQQLFVSRTAISKWESGRGLPNIDSLMAIAKFFGITVDQLLSGEQVLSIAREDAAEKQNRLRELFFALLDCGAALFFFLPLFGEHANGIVRTVSLIRLSVVQPWLKIAYFVILAATVVLGILSLALPRLHHKKHLSLLINTAGTFLFILSRQPYAAAFSLMFFICKTLILLKKP